MEQWVAEYERLKKLNEGILRGNMGSEPAKTKAVSAATKEAMRIVMQKIAPVPYLSAFRDLRAFELNYYVTQLFLPPRSEASSGLRAPSGCYYERHWRSIELGYYFVRSTHR
jgi:hypothetical protein